MDQNLIDQGLPEDENLEESGINNKGGEDKKKSKVLTVMDEARGYFKRLIKFYNSISWEKNEYKKDSEAFLFKTSPFIREKSDLSYSAVCIVVYEMCKIAKRDGQDEWEEMIDYFVTIVGEYLLVYRQMPSSLSDILANKMARKHRNLVVYSLLLLSFWADSNYMRILLKLLALNLFDSYRDNLDEMVSVMTEYNELLERKILLTEESSIRMINECYSEYLAFKSNKERKRQVLNHYTKYAIVYRPSLGFIYVEDIGHKGRVKSSYGIVSCTAIAPGFPEPLFGSNCPAKGEIERTTMRETAVVFEIK